MKKLKLPTEPKQPEIDWDTPQWVISKSGSVILTNGVHNTQNFTGMCMPSDAYPFGNLSTGWDKKQFRRLDFDIPFTISNKDD